jgi:outer membrane protein OmpA-like peptidoglycan-associated protein
MKLKISIFLFFCSLFFNINSFSNIEKQEEKIYDSKFGVSLKYSIVNSYKNKNVGDLGILKDKMIDHGFSVGIYKSYMLFNNFYYRQKLNLCKQISHLDFVTKGIDQIISSNINNAYFIDSPIEILFNYDFFKDFSLNINIGVVPIMNLYQSNSIDELNGEFENSKFINISKYTNHKTFKLGATAGVEFEYKSLNFGLEYREVFSGLAKSTMVESAFSLSFSYTFEREVKYKAEPNTDKQTIELKDIVTSKSLHIDYQKQTIYMKESKYHMDSLINSISIMEGYSSVIEGDTVLVLKTKNTTQRLKIKLISDRIQNQISSNEYNIDYDHKKITNIDYSQSVENFIENLNISDYYYCVIVDEEGKPVKKGTVLKSNYSCILYSRRTNELVHNFQLEVNSLKMKDKNSSIALIDSVLITDKYEAKTLEDIRKDLGISDNIYMVAIKSDGSYYAPNDTILTDSKIILYERDSFKKIREFRYKTRYYKLKNGEELASIDTMNLEQLKELKSVFHNILYRGGSHSFKEIAYKDLDKLIRLMNFYSDLKINVISHASYDGSNDVNMLLSVDRSYAVLRYLRENGIDDSRLYYDFKGETEPFIVTKETVKQYPFLVEGTQLSQQYVIKNYRGQQRKIARELSRRTEIKFMK